jgi:hypothetical protein
MVIILMHSRIQAKHYSQISEYLVLGENGRKNGTGVKIGWAGMKI